MIGSNFALQAAGILAILIALYHGVVGDRLVQAIQMAPAGQKPLMRGSFHIGTMGWLAGGVLLFVASFLEGGLARQAIVIVYAFVYGVPAIGNAVINRGKPNVGWIGLGIVVVLALIGR
ncbi:MAG: hypothetical protein AAF490_24795 [Chloroflexota bacterium]